MPLYEYRCVRCGHTAEVRHGFDQTYEQPCEACGGPLQRVFNAAPVLFKGSGFYVTDSRKSANTEAPKETPKTDAAAEKPAAADAPAAKKEPSSSSEPAA